MKVYRQSAVPVLGLIALLAALAGCVSPEAPPSFYKLSAMASPLQHETGPSIGIRAVTIPEYLRRSALVTESASGALQVRDRERWAEPLEDGIRRVLMLNLAATVPSNDIRTFPWSGRSAPDVVISLDFISLRITHSQIQATIQATLIPKDGPRSGELVSLVQDLDSSSIDNGAEVPGDVIAQGMSRLLLDVSKNLAGRLQP